MARESDIRIKVNSASEAEVLRQINALLRASRKRAPEIVKRLARGAVNSAAKLTIPNTGRNSPKSGRSSVRRPTMADKYRPLVNVNTVVKAAKFYIVKGAGKGNKKSKSKRRKASTASSSRGLVMRSAQGDVVVATTKKVSQKDARFKPVKKLIKAYDKKIGGWRYIPTDQTRGKYDKKSKAGRIPYYFAAKQAWLRAGISLTKGRKHLNPSRKLARLGRISNRLNRLDKPGVTMFNLSNYAHKSGGMNVPRLAVAKALRGFRAELEKRKILAEAKKRG